jgi:hypothetical protein
MKHTLVVSSLLFVFAMAGTSQTQQVTLNSSPSQGPNVRGLVLGEVSDTATRLERVAKTAAL